MDTTPHISFSKTSASVLLDGTRAGAALIVCLGHWRNLFFLSFPLLRVPHKSLFAPAYLITSAGHQAVIVFFVLSGYLIAGSIFRMMDSAAWSWRRYLTHRLVRLWIVLLPALLLGGLLDSAGYFSHHAPGLYTGHVENNMGINVLSSLNLRCWLGSAFFLQGIVTPTFGTNGPLWSLANEFWYYILFPLAVVACAGAFSAVKRFVSAALFVAISVFVGKSILLVFPVWMLGALLARIPLIRFSDRMCRLVWIVYPVIFFALAKVRFISPLTNDYVLGLATFILVLSLLNMRGPAPVNAWIRLTRTSARFSYTLYLVHVPFLVFLAAFVIKDHRWSVNLTSVLEGLGILWITFVYAYVVAIFTEFKTDGVRNWVERRLIPESTSESA